MCRRRSNPKICGRRSTLEALNPSAHKKAIMKKLARQRKQGKLGWRVLAVKFQKVLKLDSKPGVETCRRMVQELNRC